MKLVPVLITEDFCEEPYAISYLLFPCHPVPCPPQFHGSIFQLLGNPNPNSNFLCSTISVLNKPGQRKPKPHFLCLGREKKKINNPMKKRWKRSGILHLLPYHFLQSLFESKHTTETRSVENEIIPPTQTCIKAYPLSMLFYSITLPPLKQCFL